MSAGTIILQVLQYFKNKQAHALGEQALDDGIAQLKSWLS